MLEFKYITHLILICLHLIAICSFAQNNSNYLNDYLNSSNPKEKRIASLIKVNWNELELSRDSLNTILNQGISLCKSANKNHEMYQLLLIHTDKVGDYSSQRISQLDDLIVTARTNGWEKLEVEGIYWKGRAFGVQNDFDQAFKTLNALVNREDKLVEKYYKIHAITYEELAILNSLIGNSKGAVKNYKKSLKIHNENNDTLGACSNLHNLGSEYLFTKEFSEFRCFTDKSIQLAKAINDKKLELLNYLDYANKFGFNEMYDSCLVYASKAEVIAKESGNLESEARISDVMSACYLNLGQIPKALTYQLRAYELMEGDFNKNKMALNVGLVYIEMKDYLKASEYYNIALNLAKKTQSNVELSNVLNHIGFLNIKQELYEDALNRFNQSDNKISKDENPFIKSETYRGLAMTHQKLGNSIKSNKYISKALLAENSFTQLSELYLTQSKNYTKLGEFKRALKAYQNHIINKDSLTIISNKKLENTILAKYSVDKAEAALALSESELATAKALAEKEKQRKYFGFALLILSLLAILLIIKRHKKYKEQKELANKLKHDATKKIISHSRELLQNQGKLILDKNRIIQELRDNVQSYFSDDTKKSAEFENILENKILTKEDWEKFKKSFTILYPNFISFVKNKFNSISESEIRLLCLINLGYDTKEISEMLGVLPKSVQRTTNRFKNKNNIETETDLNDIVKNFDIPI